MKARIFSQLKWITGAALLVAYAQNCTKAEFGDVPPPAGVSQSLGTDPTTEIPVTTSPTPTPKPPVSAALPKLSFDYVYCPNNADCPKGILLSTAYNQVIQFKWKTNEFSASSRPDLYCQPNVGYVPKTGTVTFPVGSAAQTVVVHSLDCDNSKTIPMTITQCTANGVPFDCTLLVN